ncbi:MAG: hypothetical protein IPO81_28085 [Kouleothrix sp.]|nr:hypothetical protein [Kouleothrix sp.]
MPLFRATQEALNNIAQHAEASLAWVRLATSSGDAAYLTIRDNGQALTWRPLAAAGPIGPLWAETDARAH